MNNLTLKEFLEQTNPYGIPYRHLTKDTCVICNIPFGQGREVEVIGVITQNIWQERGGSFTSQIQMTKQLSHTNTIKLSKGLYAIYPEKVTKIF